MKYLFDTASSIISYNTSTYSSNVALNLYLLGLNGPYQGANWKLLANNRDNFLTVYNKKNNIIQTPIVNSVGDRKYVDTGSVLETIEAFYDKFYDVQSFKEPPVQYNFPIRHVLNVNGAEEDMEILSSYDNQKDKFSNEDLNSALKIDSSNVETIYDKLKNPINGINVKEVEYRDYIFPRKDHFGLKEIRTKPDYAEISGTGSNGYDRNSGVIRSFWRDNLSHRLRTNGYLAINKTGSINNLGFSETSHSLTSYDYFYHHIDAAWVTVLPTLFNQEYLFLTSSIRRNDISSSFSSVFTIDNSASISQSYETIDGLPKFVIYDSNNYNGDLTSLEEFEIRRLLSYPSGSISVDPNSGINNFTYDNLIFRPSPKASFGYYNHLPSYFKNRSRSLTDPTSYAFTFINKAFPYLTDKLSGKKPSYDSYEDFFENIKHLSRNKTILPEFKINDLMEFYIKDKNDNFTISPNINYLTLDGSTNNFNSLEAGYNSTDYFNKFIFEDNGNKKIKIKVNAVKKLLPYKGFYPQERISQIISLFKKSYIDIDDLKLLTGSNVKDPSTIDQKVQTLLQPFFAPGILFNTIKSSVAVDYPVIFTSSLDIANNRWSYQYSSTNKFPPFYESGSNTRQTEVHKTYWIGKPYNFRFPFESLLDIEQSLSSLGQEQDIMPILYPSYYGIDTFSGSDRNLMTFPFIYAGDPLWKSKNNLYKLSINNFLAEIPKFFLTNEKLNNFVSKPQKDFKSVTSGTTYFMDVSIEKNSDIQSFASVLSVYDSISNFFGAGLVYGNYFNSIASSFYGPATRWFTMPAPGSASINRTNFENLYNFDYAYIPFAPAFSMDYGLSKARIKYTPDFTGRPSLEDIISRAKIETDYFININATPGSPADLSSMKLSSSVNLFQVTNINKIRYDEFGNVKEVEEPIDDSLSAWSIQTKFETPVLNFANTLNLNAQASASFIKFSEVEAPGGGYNSFRYQINRNVGLWSGYGEKVSSGKGLTFSLSRTNNSSGSLIDICGFEEGKKDIGTFASNKIIKEAIVLIPYLEKNGNFLENNLAKNIDAIVGENGTTLSTTDKSNFYFSIDKNIIDEVIAAQFDQASEEQVFKLIKRNNINKQNSIIKCLDFLLNYNVPPHLNWLINKKIDPFVMYFLEFEHSLDQDDLSDIWQGLMPKIAMNPEIDSSIFEHPLGREEFFHGKQIPEGIKFKIFKIKKKAAKSYYELTDDVKDDNRFKFNFQNSTNAQRPSYSYNWPYDYFSLVELVNVEAGGIVTSGSA